MSQNLFKITAQECKGPLPVDVHGSKTSLLKVLLKIMTENGIYSPLVKVISNTILFVFSLRGALTKLCAGITRDGAIISMEPIPYLEKSKVSSRVLLPRL